MTHPGSVLQKNICKFSAKRRRSEKKNKKGLCPQIRKFSAKFKRQKLFLQVLSRAPRRNNIAHDLGPFSTTQE